MLQTTQFGAMQYSKKYLRIHKPSDTLLRSLLKGLAANLGITDLAVCCKF